MMKKNYLLLILATSFLISASGYSQNTNFESLFKTMHKEQLKVAKAQKFTKSEVAAIDKAMLTAGNNINKAIKLASGQPHQYLIDKINHEFKTLNSALGKAITGDKLSKFKQITTSQKNTIIRKLQSNYIGSEGANRDRIRAGIRAGIRASLIKGFGGDDPGW